MRRLLWIGLGVGAAGLAFLALQPSTVQALNLFRSKEEFVRRVWKALGEASMSLNRPEVGTVQKTILTGQAVHEGSWGAAKASQNGFNYWNLTAGTSWKGPVLLAPDLEYNGAVRKITQRFRRYGSDREAAVDFLRFIGPGTRYSSAWDSLVKGDTMDYLAKLREAGFYTQPLDKYQAAVKNAIQTVVQYLG